jgi:hypothetical protein
LNLKIQALELDVGTHPVLDPVEAARLLEKFLAPLCIQVSNRIIAIQTFGAFCDRVVIQTGCDDLKRPLSVFLRDLFEKKNRQRVRLFSGRTTGAPEAKLLEALLGTQSHEFREDDLADGIDLRLATEKVGFPDGDFIQQTPQLHLAAGSRGEMLCVLGEGDALQHLSNCIHIRSSAVVPSGVSRHSPSRSLLKKFSPTCATDSNFVNPKNPQVPLMVWIVWNTLANVSRFRGSFSS